MKIDLIAGARPNFVKIASLIHANQKLKDKITFRLIHTGQHYDKSLSGSFFEQLQLPEPDINLKSGSGSQAQQTSAIMISYEEVLMKNTPDLCIVVGDVTSSMACAITAKKMNIKLAHIEAGIRSGDSLMPEEINRILIDSIADYFFTTTQHASNNLIGIGKPKQSVFFVGNTMIDTLLKFKSSFKKPELWNTLKLSSKKYFVITFHRPGNVDENNNLKSLLIEILNNTKDLPVIFPAHPRIANILKEFNIDNSSLHIIEPLSYLEFNYLVANAKAVITDSGGITEETTILGVPCMTIRDNTERPETVSIGTNELLGTNLKVIAPALDKLYSGNWKKGAIPELWDGKTGDRILSILSSM
jgi:UDP-N-acetylglucosamine 2-epimerase (non-hydrolysing)